MAEPFPHSMDSGLPPKPNIIPDSFSPLDPETNPQDQAIIDGATTDNGVDPDLLYYGQAREYVYGLIHSETIKYYEAQTALAWIRDAVNVVLAEKDIPRP